METSELLAQQENPDPEYAVILANLLREEMNGRQDQVVVYNEDQPLPTDSDWYLMVAFLSGEVYGQSKSYIPTSAGLTESQGQNVKETYSLMLFSSSRLARLLKQEVLFAFNSDRAERLQALYNFKIANLPASFHDVSAVEATARLNRYDLDFNLLVAYSRQRATEYFDQFQNPPKTLLVNP